MKQKENKATRVRLRCRFFCCIFAASIVTLKPTRPTMNKMKFFCLAVLLAMGSTAAMAQWRQVDPRANVGLKDAYKDYFTIGVALNQRNIADESQTALVKKEFNSVTAENDWKPGEIHPKEGVWNFEKADKIADFCRQNGIKMRGHCLCWHSQFADWMFTDKKGKPS